MLLFRIVFLRGHLVMGMETDSELTSGTKGSFGKINIELLQPRLPLFPIISLYKKPMTGTP